MQRTWHLGKWHRAKADRIVTIDLPAGIRQMHQRQPRAALLEAVGKILADEMRIGDVIGNAYRVITVLLERVHQLADRRQERERHVLDPQRGAGCCGDRAEPVAAASGTALW